jgi:hypothetical protein
MTYEAFVYRFTNIVDGKKYLGYHTGSIYDGYVTSATSEEMQEAFAKGHMEREIIEYGTTQDMIALERKMLLEVDAMNNPQYYNKTNGGGKALKGFIKPSLDELQRQIVNQSFDVQLIEKNLVAEYDKFQARFNAIDSKHLNHIKEKIDDANGDTTSFVPVNVLQDYKGKGLHLVLDGNHRISAIIDSKRAKYINVQFIPKDAWKSFTLLELTALAHRLNPLPDKPALAVNKDDGVKFILKSYEEGLGINSEQNVQELLSWGFTKKAANGVIKTAQTQIDTKIALPPGAVWINWTNGRYKKELDFRAEQYRDKDTIAVTGSSGGWRLDHLLEDSILFPNKKKAVVVMYHPTPAAQKKWFNHYLPRIEKAIDMRIDMKIDFVYMETIDYKAGLQDSENVV